MPLLDINWHPGSRELRTFGLICTGACIALGLWVTWRHAIAGIDLTPLATSRLTYVLAACAAASAALALLAPMSLRSLYVALTAISAPIGFVVSYLMLATLFFLVLTPYGLVFRLIGRDALSRRFDRMSSSYWRPRPRVTDRARYFRQY